MEKWISRRCKSSRTSASPQERFCRGRWIWIPIRRRIVHMLVICYEVSAGQILTPFLPSSIVATSPVESFQKQDSSRHPRLKCSWMKWQVAITPTTFFLHLLLLLPLIIWSIYRKTPVRDVGNISHTLMLTTSDERTGDKCSRWKCAP